MKKIKNSDAQTIRRILYSPSRAIGIQLLTNSSLIRDRNRRPIIHSGCKPINIFGRRKDMGLVSTVAIVTNSAPSGYNLVVTDNQNTDNKPTTISGGDNAALNWEVPWYTDKHYPWPGRSLYFEFQASDGTVCCGASVWQHGVGVLWEEGTHQPSNPSTGNEPPLAQEGAHLQRHCDLEYSPQLAGRLHDGSLPRVDRGDCGCLRNIIPCRDRPSRWVPDSIAVFE